MLGNQDLNNFIADLGTRYDAYSRNEAWDEKTGKETIIPASENSKVRDGLQQTIDELCAFYLKGSDDERDHIRKLVEVYRSLHQGLLDHVVWVTRRIESSQDSAWVRRGLAAASIEDNRLDFRDLFVALGELYLAAARVGIDASHCFGEAAQLSSAIVGPVFKHSMKEFLANFEKSAYFKQAIQPKLPHR